MDAQWRREAWGAPLCAAVMWEYGAAASNCRCPADVKEHAAARMPLSDVELTFGRG